MRKNNRGFSLIELVVVIAIGIILTLAMTLSLRTVSGTAVKQCAKEIKSIINKTKSSTMGKDEVTLTLSMDEKGALYAYLNQKDGTGSVSEEKSKVGRSNLDIKYTLTDASGASEVRTMKSGDSITIQFDRGSGRLSYNDDGTCCTKIEISKNSTKRTVTIYKETGKVVLE